MSKSSRLVLIILCITFTSLSYVEAKKSKEPQFVVKDGYKSITYNGITYKGLTTVSEKSFKRARYVVDTMLEKVPYVRNSLVEVGYKVVLMADGQKLTEIPEYEYYKGKKAYQNSWSPKRSFDTDIPGMSEFDLCVVSDVRLMNSIGEDIMAHELAHAILSHMYKEDSDIVHKIYMNAFEKRLYPSDKYIMKNYREYWAVASTAWLGVAKDYPGNDGVDSAEKLKARDPKIAAFLETIYGQLKLERPNEK